ncbi:MAG: aminodeoxychorismate synthase component I [Armatimonadota bacterium]
MQPGKKFSNNYGTILLQRVEANGRTVWLRFASPERVVIAARPAQVLEALHEIETAVDRGWYAAGMLSYEASPAFDEAFVTHAPGPLPVLWFGLYREPEVLSHLPAAEGQFHVTRWLPSVSQETYRAAIARVKEYIAAGDTYQVNYTLRMRSAFGGDPWSLFTALHRAQRGAYSACLDLGRHVICSASPELFFRLSGQEIVTRPMKGTAPRGLSWPDDEARARELQASEKNRAENVMIVDMIRNDLGRIARTGTVKVRSLFDIERYPTLLQLTSTVAAETAVPVSEVFRALFPCASITGAPKVRTMEIIAELEDSPRGVYTGCIGWWAPGRQAQFNVAIRTVHVDREAGRVEYGVGGGIVWDSVDRDEYRECEVKACVLYAESPEFRLLETLLWIPGRGYFLLDRHLRRLADSGRYFGFRVDVEEIRMRLEAAAAELTAQRHRVRLLVDEEGGAQIETYPLSRAFPREPWKVALASTPVDPRDRFLYHKTTHRAVYDAARAEHPGCDDVILYNERGEVTESALANIIVRFGNDLITPPVECGLLAGTYRAHLLDRGCLREGIITLDDLHRADAVYLINSVRRWIPAHLECGG